MRTLRLAVVSALGMLSAPLHAQTSTPFEFLQSALARHRLVFLGDIHPIAEPKQLVARLIREQDAGAGIDLLALEVASEHQGTIDRHLASLPEDTSLPTPSGGRSRSWAGITA